MHFRERTSQTGVIAVRTQIEVFEHEERFFLGFSSAHRSRNTCTARRKRREAVGLRGEIVQLRAVVGFCEVLAALVLEYEAPVDATSLGGRGALDVKSPRGIRDRGFQCCEKFRGCDHAGRKVLRTRDPLR